MAVDRFCADSQEWPFTLDWWFMVYWSYLTIWTDLVPSSLELGHPGMTPLGRRGWLFVFAQSDEDWSGF